MDAPTRRGMLVSRAWFQAALLVFVIGFAVLGLLAVRTYTAGPPIPTRALAPDGTVLFTAADVTEGQQVFLRNGLMEYGSIFGHGGYLGPDYTAESLRLASRTALSLRLAAGSDRAEAEVVEEFRRNTYDPATGDLPLSAGQAAGFQELVRVYTDRFADPDARQGLRPAPIPDPREARQLTAFFFWTAWAAATERPGKDYSYTSNWPPEPRVGNVPPANALVWSVLSLIALLGGIGLLLGAFGRWNFLGWHGRDRQTLRFRTPGTVGLTPAQRSTAWYFLVVALLFLIQTVVGGATQHYRAEVSDFFGVDIARYLPFNLVRTWHVQLAIFWVAAAFLAAGIFLAPLVSGHEPRRQNVLSYLLLGAVAFVVFGSMIGELLGIHGLAGDLWAWFGAQGFEYLDLGRFWQILLTVGLAFWVVLLFRALRPRLRREHPGNMPWLFFFAALAIPAFYAVGLLARPDGHFTVTDFWRFWVVHLWVEDFLELFTTVMVAYLFVMLGVVDERVALRLIYLDIILYSAGGVIGTMHHVYFSGEPAEHLALGGFFSAAEVIPLTFLTLEAWSFVRLGGIQAGRDPTPFPHKWAVAFLIAVGFWNFLGAGVFGFLINLPIVSYYEIGTALTANHGHAAMMGVYGMLAVGLSLFCLRYLVSPDRWSDRAAKWSFWSLNIGLAWMVFATLFPVGIAQLWESVDTGYYEARQLQFLFSDTNRWLQWMRLPGDAMIILGGVLPFLALAWQGVRHPARIPEGAPTRLTDVAPAAEA